MSSSIFNRSFLPDAAFEFVVIGDTHYMPDPEAYATEFESARFWSDRAGRALQLAASLEAGFVVHLGDLAQTIPGNPGYETARRMACEQIARTGLQPYHVAGNTDIGDKPDPSMPSEWVTPETLSIYHEALGRSWYSFDYEDIHGVVLNSQIMNSALPEAEEQKQWLEADLAGYTNKRIFIFMHMPPFFVEENEPDQGFYNSIDEPARSWLLGLLRQYRVELLFCGHTHFTAFNRADETRLYVTPSTTTSRAGFYEVFSIVPPVEQGRNDTAKLGFYLVRVHTDGTRVHFIRTNGETESHKAEIYSQRLITRLSRDLGASPLGVFLRTPLAHVADGTVAWPGVIRQQVRDDHPFFACLELGLQHVRIPVDDLNNPLQSHRLKLLRDEGVQITACQLLYDRLDLTKTIRKYADQIDAIEVQLSGCLWPEEVHMDQIAQCRAENNLPITLAPLLPREPTKGKFHPRSRMGYHISELTVLNSHLSHHDLSIDRVVCHIDAGHSPLDTIQALMEYPSLSHIQAFDLMVSLTGFDEQTHVDLICETLVAVAALPVCRLFLDPLTDLDRTNDTNHGLLDRLSNPRPAFHAARCLNTILFGSEDTYLPVTVDSYDYGRVFRLEGQKKRLWLIIPDRTQTDHTSASKLIDAHGQDVLSINPVQGYCRGIEGGDQNLQPVLDDLMNPLVIISNIS